MIDVHVLTLPSLPPEWIAQRRSSIAEAVERAGYPVNVYEVEGIAGHLGRSRTKGYSMGSSPYVTHVDHDDWLHPGALAMLRKYMERGDEAITTGEVQVFDDRTIDQPGSRHHLAVYKRSFVKAHPIGGYEFYPDQYLMSQAKPTHLPVCAYYHRISMDSASRMQRRGSRDRAAKELASIGRPDLSAVELMSYADVAQAVDAEMEMSE